MKAKITSVETRKIQATGTCEICKKEAQNLLRTIFRFEEIQCKCCSPYHFSVWHHCETCVPKTPKFTYIYVEVSDGRIERAPEKIVKEMDTFSGELQGVCYECGHYTASQSIELCELCAAGH